MNFSSVSHSHGLQFSVNCSSVGPFPGVSFLQKQTASMWICCRDESHQQSCSNMGSSLCTYPASNLLHGVLVSSGCIHLLQCGALHELEGDSLPLHGLHHELGKLCSGNWSTCFFTDLGVRTVSLTYSHTSPLTGVVNKIFFPFLSMLSCYCYGWLGQFWPAVLLVI